MKLINYALILSVMIWPVYPSLALATATDTNTNTNTNSDCVSSGKTYGNGSFSHCTTADTQEKSQEDTTNLNNSGAQQSMMLGMMATAAGAGLVAAGMACSCPGPNGGMIAAGAALIAAGMMGMQAAGNMANNAGISDWNDYNTDSLTPNSTFTNTVTGTSTPDPKTPGGIEIDDSFTRTGKSGLVFDDFENKTGIGRDALAEGLKSGRSIADILAESERLKKQGYDADKIAASLNNSGASALGADEVMNKLGLTPEELAAMANKNSAMGDDSAYALGGSGASRTPASASATGIDGMFGANGANSSSTLGGLTGIDGKLSSDVQNALDRNGITDLSIFQMVHLRYKTKTPMMFGESSRKPSSTAENPFSNLGAGGKIEF